MKPTFNEPEEVVTQALSLEQKADYVRRELRAAYPPDDTALLRSVTNRLAIAVRLLQDEGIGVPWLCPDDDHAWNLTLMRCDRCGTTKSYQARKQFREEHP